MKKLIIILVCYFVTCCDCGTNTSIPESRTYETIDESPEEARGFLMDLFKPMTNVFTGMFGGTRVIKGPPLEYITTTPKPWFSYPTYPSNFENIAYDYYSSSSEESGEEDNSGSNDSGESEISQHEPSASENHHQTVKRPNRDKIDSRPPKHRPTATTSKPNRPKKQAHSSKPNTGNEGSFEETEDHTSSEEEDGNIFEQMGQAVAGAITDLTESFSSSEEDTKTTSDTDTTFKITSTTTSTTTELPYEWQFIRRRRPTQQHLPNLGDFPDLVQNIPPSLPRPNFPETPMNTNNFPPYVEKIPITQPVRYPLYGNRYKFGAQYGYLRRQNDRDNIMNQHKLDYTIREHNKIRKNENMKINSTGFINKETAIFTLPSNVNKIILRQTLPKLNASAHDITSFIDNAKELQNTQTGSEKHTSVNSSNVMSPMYKKDNELSSKIIDKFNLRLNQDILKKKRLHHSKHPKIRIHLKSENFFNVTLKDGKMLSNLNNRTKVQNIENPGKTAKQETKSNARKIRSVFGAAGRQLMSGNWLDDTATSVHGSDEPGWLDTIFDITKLLTPSSNDLLIPNWIYGLFFNRDHKQLKPSMINPVDNIITTTEPSWFGSMDIFQPLMTTHKKQKPEPLMMVPTSMYSGNRPKRKSYSGYELLTVQPNGYYALETLLDLYEAAQGSEIQWWTGQPRMAANCDILIPPDLVANFKKHLKNEGVEYEVRVRDMQRVIATQNPRLTKRQRNALTRLQGHPMTWTSYHDGDDISSYLHYLTVRYPRLVKLHTIGRSYEARPLLVLEISLPHNATADSFNEDSSHEFRDLTWKAKYRYSSIFDDFGINNDIDNRLQKRRRMLYRNAKRKLARNAHSKRSSRYKSAPQNIKIKSKHKIKRKPGIWLDAGWHGREWISTAVLTWFIKTLVEGDPDNGIPRDYSMLEKADYFIMPVANPDSYQYSHEHDRLWLKSRSHTEKPESMIWNIENLFNWNFFPWLSRNINNNEDICTGVDPDHNWGHSFTKVRPCTENYAGPRAFSEPETKAVAEFIIARRRKMKVFLSMRAYSQLWSTPDPDPEWNADMPAGGVGSAADRLRLAGTALRALERTRGTKYRSGTQSGLMQPATGSAAAWAKSIARIRYSYTVYLPDTGTHGYLLPAQQIVPVGTETVAGIKALVQNL